MLIFSDIFFAYVELATTTNLTTIMMNEKLDTNKGSYYLICLFAPNFLLIYDTFGGDSEKMAKRKCSNFFTDRFTWWCMQLEEKIYLDKSLKKNKQFSRDIVFVEHWDYIFRIPRVIFDQKHPFINEKKSFLDILSSLSNCLPFFHFFLLQSPPYLNYIDFAAKRSPPMC